MITNTNSDINLDHSSIAVVRTLSSIPAAHLAVEVIVVAILEGGAAAARLAALQIKRGTFYCPLATPLRNLGTEFGDVQQVFEHVEHLKGKDIISKLTCIQIHLLI